MRSTRSVPTGVVLLLIGLHALLPGASRAQDVVVGSKDFTENLILAEMAVHLTRSEAELSVRHQAGLGGTQFLWNALLRGDIDVYPEYTGTLLQETFADLELQSIPALRSEMEALGLRMTGPLGFNNTYALGMQREVADSLGIRTISDLRSHPTLRFGFSNEFMDRGDGWPAVRARYQLPQQNVQGLSHELAYRGVASSSLALTDLYSTDAEIAYYDLLALEDDLNHFPRYDAVYVYRADLAERAPDVVASLEEMAGQIDEAAMVAMNARAKIDGIPAARVAARFLEAEDLVGAPIEVRTATRFERVGARTREHLWLVGVSLGAAILVAIPLGIWAAKRARAGAVILGVVGIIYTIPSLALLVFMIPLLGIGGLPAMVALFLYSLLPIVRNTHTGLTTISPAYLISAEALGLSKGYKLRRVELPLAAPAILSGIKTSAVINIGTATLGALIGAGGYGQPILTGIRLDDAALILEGAVPAALLAVAAQGLFAAAERWLVPKGLRLT